MVQYGFVTLGLPIVVLFCAFGLGFVVCVIGGHLWVVLLICVGVGLAVFVLWIWMVAWVGFCVVIVWVPGI